MAEEKPALGIPPDAWPVPLDLPLYVSVERAARLAGIGCDRMYEYVNSLVATPCKSYAWDDPSGA